MSRPLGRWGEKGDIRAAIKGGACLLSCTQQTDREKRRVNEGRKDRNEGKRLSFVDMLMRVGTMGWERDGLMRV